MTSKHLYGFEDVLNDFRQNQIELHIKKANNKMSIQPEFPKKWKKKVQAKAL